MITSKISWRKDPLFLQFKVIDLTENDNATDPTYPKPSHKVKYGKTQIGTHTHIQKHKHPHKHTYIYVYISIHKHLYLHYETPKRTEKYKQTQ